jgi:ribosome-binding factor A
MVRKRRQGAAYPDDGEVNRRRGQRPLRVGEEVRHALAKLLRGGECRDPVLHDVSITVAEVRMSPDLRNATAYVMPLGGANAETVMQALRRGAPYLKSRLAREVPLRRVPELSFALDSSFAQAEHIAAVLDRPEVKRDLQPAAGSGSADADDL